MAEDLTVDEMTHNRISVTWKIKEATLACDETMTSRRFSLLNDGYFVHFSMIINYKPDYELKVEQEMPKPGRAIIAISLDRRQAAVIFRRHLLESWKGVYKLDCPGPLPYRYGDSLIIIKCDITWLGFLDSSDMLKVPHIPKEICLQSIPYNNELMADVKLIMNGKELSTHKSVLVLHSPVFLGMFETPMRESKENQVVIEDTDFDTMETLLKIIYTGETEELNDVPVALKILAVAEKYQMAVIKNACEYKLQLNVKHDNVFQLLDEADKYNAGELLQLCIDYIFMDKKVPIEDFKAMCLKRASLSAALINTQFEKIRSIPSNDVRSS